MKNDVTQGYLPIGSTAWSAALMLFAVVVLSGCMVGPDYQRPQVEVPQAWLL